MCLSQRPDGADIVGPGIYLFAFVWSKDSNLHERHGDSMLSRIDAKNMRLHPQQGLSGSQGQIPKASKYISRAEEEAIRVWEAKGS